MLGDDVRGAGETREAVEGTFVVDRNQRIVQWDHGAAALIGVGIQQTLSQPCYEVVEGRDSFGRQLCGPECPAIKALRRGRLSGRSTLVAGTRNGHSLRLRCELTALPPVPGGAVARLATIDSPRSFDIRLAPETSFNFPNLSPYRVVQDLAALAKVTTSLSVASLQGGLEPALDTLCEATEAEAAEVFLAEPEGRGMVLAGHRGLFRHDFSQITRFDPGEGFPGLALARREPILTNRLNEDARYLRTRVKERGIRSYVCVPLCGPEGVIGSIHVASRNPNFALGRALSLLSWASVPISMAVQASFLSLRELGNRSSLDPRDDLESGFRHTLGQVLHRMVSVSEAQGGSLDLVRPGKKGLAERVIEGSIPVSSCPALEGDDSLVCPALDRGQGVVLYEQRKSWPPPCQESPRRGSVCYCVPLLVDGETIGVARIVYQGQSPSPPTRNLVAAEKVGEAAARTIRDAWNYLERERRKDAAHRAWLQVGTDAPWETGLRALPRLARVQREDVREGAPYLDIRCFGSFELYRDGLLITPDMVHRRKAIALLKILLTYDGRPVTKDTLIELLWPEVKPEAGAGRLHVLVHELRRLVEPPEHEGKWVFIQSEGDRYYFNTKASCRVDVREFKALVNLGQRARAKGDTEAAIHAYEAAAEIYRGDFLEDEPYAEWCWEQREHLKEVCLDAFRRLAGIHAKLGEWEQSVKHLRSALWIDKLREEVHRELMRSLWAAGRRDEAIHQYEVCKELLRRELDVAPLPETEKLVQQIRASPGP